ncbi:MAG: hypothetical protein JST21_02315 [Bacteroidetes bacterium]|nr:hypothetical protein [Bacteroidota bacterium]
MENILIRINQLAENENLTITKLENKIGASKGVLSRALSKNTDIQTKWLSVIVENYPQYNADWLLTGTPPMLRKNIFRVAKKGTKRDAGDLIPLFDDIGTIGGTNLVADDNPFYYPTEYIDPGDLFPGATAAIRHYNDSMKEYISGSILILQELHKPFNFIWGEDYVIEYAEYRITKKIRKGKNGYVTACSTNEDTYTDGKHKYEPIDIQIDSIRRLFLVTGFIIKRHSSGIVFNKNKVASKSK